MRLAGFKFGRGMYEPCDYVHLSLCFVLPTLGEMEPLEALRLSQSYARLFPHPEVLYIKFVRSFGWAGATGGYLRPALGGDLSETVDVSGQISTSFKRGIPNLPCFAVYSGGKLIFELKDDPQVPMGSKH